MVTRIEVANYIIKKTKEGNGLKNEICISPNRRLVAEFPDSRGPHPFQGGKVKLEFKIDENGHRSLVIDSTHSAIMRKELRRPMREVSVSRENMGTVMVNNAKMLIVSTGASDEQFKNTERR